MPVSFVGAAAAIGDTVDPPAHVAGDLLVCFAVNLAAPTSFAGAAGWTVFRNQTAAGTSARGSFLIATGPGTPGGVWSGYTGILIAVFRGADPVSPIGAGHLMSAANSNTPSFQGISLDRTIGSSMVFGAWGHASASNMDTAPAGMTLRAAAGGGPQIAGFDTAGGVASWATQGITANLSGNWRALVAEIRAEHRAFAAGGMIDVTGSLDGGAGVAFSGARQMAVGDLLAAAALEGHAVLRAAPGRLIAARRRILRLPGRPLFWDAKRPEERDLFGLDLAPVLTRPDGVADALVSVQWTVPAGLVLHAQGHAGPVAIAEISGGAAGMDYALDCLAATAAGRSLLTRVRLPVRAP